MPFLILVILYQVYLMFFSYVLFYRHNDCVLRSQNRNRPNPSKYICTNSAYEFVDPVLYFVILLRHAFIRVAWFVFRKILPAREHKNKLNMNDSIIVDRYNSPNQKRSNSIQKPSALCSLLSLHFSRLSQPPRHSSSMSNSGAACDMDETLHTNNKSSLTLNTFMNQCNRWETGAAKDDDSLDTSVLLRPRRNPSDDDEDETCSSDCIMSKGSCTEPTGSIDSYTNNSYSSGTWELNEASLSSLLDQAMIVFDEDENESALQASLTNIQLKSRPCPQNKHLRRFVTFNERTSVREHSVTLGDSPSCSGSCPLSLDWPYRLTRSVLQGDTLKKRMGMCPTLSFKQRRARLETFLEPDELLKMEMDLELDSMTAQVQGLRSQLQKIATTKGEWPRHLRKLHRHSESSG
jgi:hypothetical protein